MSDVKLPTIILLIATCMLFVACSDDGVGLVDLPPGDQDSAASDSDLDWEGAVGDQPADGDEPEDSDLAFDGDEEPVEDLDTEFESVDDDSFDISETDMEELESEPEIEPEPLCNSLSDPFELMEIRAEVNSTTDGWQIDGQISDPCQTDAYIIAGGIGSKLRIKYEPLGLEQPLIGRMVVADVAAASRRRPPHIYFDESDSFPLGGMEEDFQMLYSGEIVVTVSGKGYADNTGLYRLSVSCIENCDVKYTRNPVVLLHGMAGWNSFLEIYDYFRNVKGRLKELGYNTYATEAAMFNDSDYRAAEIESQLMDILNETGARKLNLLAHSQGGIDSRIFISEKGHGEDVALLAMVATPNRGVITGDIILGLVPGVGQDVIGGLFDFFGNLIDGSESDIVAALGQISMAQMGDIFNPAHPDDPNVTYWSWSGHTCGDVEFSCQSENNGEWVNPALSMTYRLMQMYAPSSEFEDNDGMVPVASAMWGEWKGLVSADHADEIGQLKTGNFDHIAFYEDIVRQMFEAGF